MSASRQPASSARYIPSPVFSSRLLELAGLRSGEGAPVIDQLFDGAWGFAGHDLHRQRVSEKVTLLERVGEVLLPGVLGVDGAERRIDPTGGEHGVGVLPEALSDDHDLAAGLVDGDRGPQA